MSSLWRLLLGISDDPPGADGLKSEGYVVYSEFGPALLIPRPQRMAERFPSVPPQEREAWMQDFQRVDTLIWKLAKEGVGNRPGGELEAALLAEFPFMNRSALARALTRVNYYAWHEGYG